MLATLQLATIAAVRDLATMKDWGKYIGDGVAQKVTCGAVTNSCLAFACLHAPGPLVHRIHVIPLQTLQAWTSLHLADAVC